jgi:hypothetical protein
MKVMKLNLDSLKDKKQFDQPHQIKDGDNIYRILPALGEESNGCPFKKYYISWLEVEGKPRPVASPFSFGEKNCPIFEYCNLLKDKLTKELIPKRHKNNLSEEDSILLDKAIELIPKIESDIKPKKVFYYNAVNKSGKVAALQLKATANESLTKLMSEHLNVFNQDPTSLQSNDEECGVWWNFIREGVGRDTTYSVKKVEKIVKEGKRVFTEPDTTPLSDNLVQNYEKLAVDIYNFHKRHTVEEVKEMLVKFLKSKYTDILQFLEVKGFSLLDESSEEKVVIEAPKATPKNNNKKINLKLDDEDDDIPEFKPTKKKNPFEVDDEDDDDFFADADKKLNK